jgi:hypothetical protein
MFKKLSNPHFCMVEYGSSSLIEERYDSLDWDNLYVSSMRDMCEVTSDSLTRDDVVIEYLSPVPIEWESKDTDKTPLYVNRITLDGVRQAYDKIKEIPETVDFGTKYWVNGKKIVIGYMSRYDRICPVCGSIIGLSDTKCKFMNNRTVLHPGCLRDFSRICYEPIESDVDAVVSLSL